MNQNSYFNNNKPDLEISNVFIPKQFSVSHNVGSRPEGKIYAVRTCSKVITIVSSSVKGSIGQTLSCADAIQYRTTLEQIYK